MRERFLGEARALARLRHPAIVPVYELGRDAERCFIAMGLVEGPSLAEHRARDPRGIDARRAAEIIAELAEALEYAHGQGILHRDVKPANILFDGSGGVYLTDFGLAYRSDSAEVSSRPDARVGTPAYAAPEQAAAEHPRAMAASDQYSLGVVFYELLCGRTPFAGPPLYILYQAMSLTPPSPRSINPAVPAPLAAICLKAIAKRPESRYPSCADLADDLRRWRRAARVNSFLPQVNLAGDRAEWSPTMIALSIVATPVEQMRPLACSAAIHLAGAWGWCGAPLEPGPLRPPSRSHGPGIGPYLIPLGRHIMI